MTDAQKLIMGFCDKVIKKDELIKGLKESNGCYVDKKSGIKMFTKSFIEGEDINTDANTDADADDEADDGAND